jgi:extradiol dioxygenase family protein
MALCPFHLAFPVRDLAEARAFYGGLLGCREGRSSESWVDFDFFGHQIVAHLSAAGSASDPTNEVDGEQIPVRHFGVVLPWDEFPVMERRLRERGARFLVEPTVRFRGKPGEQATMFVMDPSGNALEFKAFRDPKRIFAK